MKIKVNVDIKAIRNTVAGAIQTPESTEDKLHADRFPSVPRNFEFEGASIDIEVEGTPEEHSATLAHYAKMAEFIGPKLDNLVAALTTTPEIHLTVVLPVPPEADKAAGSGQ